MLEMVDKMLVQPQALPAPPPQALQGVEAVEAAPPQAAQDEQAALPAPKNSLSRLAEQGVKADEVRPKRRKLRLEGRVPQPQGPSEFAQPPSSVDARRSAGRPKGSVTVLKLDSVNSTHREIMTWLKVNLPKFVSEVPEARKKKNQVLYLTDLQEALLAIPVFRRMVDGRKIAVESLKIALFRAFPISTVGERKAYHHRIGPADEKGGRHGFHHYELDYDKLEILIKQMP